jgi:hypothetical protein
MKTSTLLRTAIALGVAGIAYSRLGRPRVLNWGARTDEVLRPMPGDDILPDASLQTTRVISINAPPRDIWPWLAQMGPRPRAGAYTYDWIERRLGIDIQNADRILPEYQHLEVGEFLGLNDKSRGIVVREVRPEEALVLQWIPAKSTWAFGLYLDEGRGTRLVSRNRLSGSGLRFWLGMVAFMEPGSLIMERKMLLGIKRRAEQLARLDAEHRTQSALGNGRAVQQGAEATALP